MCRGCVGVMGVCRQVEVKLKGLPECEGASIGCSACVGAMGCRGVCRNLYV